MSPLQTKNFNSYQSPDVNQILELEDDTRTFEEKYVLSEKGIIGEGCSSVVKECSFRVPKSYLQKVPEKLINETSPLLQIEKCKNQ